MDKRDRAILMIGIIISLSAYWLAAEIENSSILTAALPSDIPPARAVFSALGDGAPWNQKSLRGVFAAGVRGPAL